MIINKSIQQGVTSGEANFIAITPKELKYLARCVELLKEQTEKSCEKKIESFV